MPLLTASFPVLRTNKSIFISAFSTALLVYLFLVVMQPFGTYNYNNSLKYLLLLPYAFIAFFVFGLADLLLAKRDASRFWTWRNEIFRCFGILTVCGFVNYFYNSHFIKNSSFEFSSLLMMVFYTYMMGIPICTIIILAKKSFENRDQQITVSSVSETNSQQDQEMIITPDIGEPIQILSCDFLFARSDGNYTTIHFMNAQMLSRLLIRISLKELEHQICNFNIIRCHRSYILNLQKITHKSGNAQGYKVKLENCSETIPISRNFIKACRLHL